MLQNIFSGILIKFSEKFKILLHKLSNNCIYAGNKCIFPVLTNEKIKPTN